MMFPEHDPAHLRAIFQQTDLIQLFTAGMDQAAFLADAKTQYAVIRALEILGEAAKRLSEQFQMQNPDLAWRTLAEIRNIALIGYDRIDYERVWDMIQAGIPPLMDVLMPLINSESVTTLFTWKS